MVEFGQLPTIWCRDRYPWDTGVEWQAICEHEAQYPIRPNAARDIVGFLRAPADTAGIHYAVDATEIWRGTDHRDRAKGRSPHCYRPSRWSVGIEHAGYTVPGNYDGPAGTDMLMVSAVLHAALIDEWEARPANAGVKFPLQVLDVDGVIAMEPGLFTHDTATQACVKMRWSQNGHYDGRYYPFDRLIDLIEQVRGEVPVPTTPPEEDDEMAKIQTFFPPGSTPNPASGLQAFVEVEWSSGQAHGWHGVVWSTSPGGPDDAGLYDSALDGDLRTVDFVKLNGGLPVRDFRINESAGEVIAFGQGGSIFRAYATAG